MNKDLLNTISCNERGINNNFKFFGIILNVNIL